MGAANRVAVNTGILYARMAITVFISLYATRLVLAALGAEDYGIFNVVGGAIVMLTFLNNAMASASQRFMSYAHGEGDEGKQKKIFNVSVIVHFVIGIFLVAIMEIVGYFLFKGVLKIDVERIAVAKLIYHFLVVSTFTSVISVPYNAVLNAHENMLFVAILGVIESLLKLSIAFYVTYTGFDKLASYGFLMAMLTILLLLIGGFYCHKKYDEVEINIIKYYDKPLLKEMTGFAGWSLLGSSSSMIANYGQGIVINMFFGTVINAAQGVAAQVSGQLGAFATTMMKALNPIIAKSEGAGNRSMMLRASVIGGKVSFFLLMFFYVPVLVEMPLIFNFWLKNVPEFTVVFCRLLLTRNLIEQLFLTLSSSIAAVGNIKKYQIFSSILNFLPLPVSYVLFVYGFPPYFLYIVFIVYAVLKGGVVLYFSKRDCGLDVLSFAKHSILRATLSFSFTIALASLPVAFMNEGFMRLLCVFVVSFIAYLIFVAFIGFRGDERKIFTRMINEVLGRVLIIVRKWLVM